MKTLLQIILLWISNKSLKIHNSMNNSLREYNEQDLVDKEVKFKQRWLL